MKRMLSIATAIVMVLTSFNITAFADVTTTDAATCAQLETALQDGAEDIRITADFEIDRTLYVDHTVKIYTDAAHTLTRADDFAGDIFVVGETAGGETANAVLTLGDPESDAEDLLTIDGNKDSMTVDVTGSVIFTVSGSTANLYKNVTVTNCKKTGNVKASGEAYSLSSAPATNGGAVFMIPDGSFVNVYGGKYTYNEVSTSSSADSYKGGVAFNHGTLSIYGGTFDNNSANRGGAFFNYRRLYIYSGTLSNNTSVGNGGAIDTPNTSARLYIGTDNEVVSDTSVLFEGNVSGSAGGAVYAYGNVRAKNTVFRNNESGGVGGALGLVNSSSVSSSLTLDNTTFSGNTATGNGGAVYVAGSSSVVDEETVYRKTALTVTDSAFSGNTSNGASGGGAVYATVTTISLDNVRFNGNAAKYGAAIYDTNNSELTMTDVKFISNASSASGAAIYSSASVIDADGAVFSSNTATSNAGGIYIAAGNTVRLNNVKAVGNSAANAGFIYNTGSDLDLFDSYIAGNTVTGTAGAIYTLAGTVNIADTDFDGNSAGKTNGHGGGALYCQTSGDTVSVWNCSFTNNSADNGWGGVASMSGSTQLNLYNVTATGNSANKGGLMYVTPSGTNVRLVGITLSGNTFTEGGGGNIIWSNTANAKTYIDDDKYVDLDNEGAYDSAYWVSAVYYKPGLIHQSMDIPSYTDYYGNTVTAETENTVGTKVWTSIALAAALERGDEKICVMTDIDIDRTMFVTGTSTVYSSRAVTLTRAADFDSDIFVIGEDSSGVAVEGGATLTLGDPESDAEDLLTIDGNKAGMTVDVLGSVIFTTSGSTANLYSNVTIKNCRKLGNEKALGEAYSLSSAPATNGGAVFMIPDGSFVNVYGGKYTGNEVAATSSGDSYKGGVAFNHGTLRIYGGTFDHNSAVRGGAFFNYRRIYLYNGALTNNTSTGTGGAIDTPATNSLLYIGTDNEVVEDTSVLFAGNTSGSGGGAVLTQGTAQLKNVVFRNNTATGNGTFYISAGTLTAENVTFENNTTSGNGAGFYVTSSTAAKMKNITATGNSASNGGFLLNAGTTDIYDSYIAGNTVTAAGGGIYTSSAMNIVNTDFIGNSSTRASSYGGGAMHCQTSGAQVNIFNSNFIDNTAETALGGAISMTGSTHIDLYGVTAIGNVANKGGFMYVTPSGTEVKLAGVTVSGNSFTEGGGGPIIWSNTNAAHTYIDPDRYVDADYDGSYDSAYWAEAVSYRPGLTLQSIEIPSYTDFDGNTVTWEDATAAVKDVNSSAALYAALIGGKANIRITADFEIDRTYFVTGQSNLFTDEAHTLTRAADFASEIFVVGENTVGATAADAVLTLGNPESAEEDLLTIDGNKDNMTVDVLGSVILTGHGATANIYPNVTVTNCCKTGNDRIVSGSYALSNYKPTNGGAVFMIADGTFVNVYGGKFTSNEVSTSNDGDSYKGGIAFNHGTMTVYGGLFEGGEAQSGGAVFNYRRLYIYGGEFRNNSSAGAGGMVYTPGTSAAKLFIGTENDLIADTSVLIEGNTSGTSGGAIYGQSTIKMKNVTFRNNESSSNGGALCLAADMTFTAEDCNFTGNAAVNGGAVYISTGTASMKNITASGNSAGEKGGFIYVKSAEAKLFDSTLTENSAVSGGAAAFDSAAVTGVYNTVFTSNTASSSGHAGGAVYCANGGASNGSSATFHDCTFTENSSTHKNGNGGALLITTSAALNLYDCTATGNSTKAYGGFAYITSALTVVRMGGLTVSGNTAKNGPTIWGNNASTTLYMDSARYTDSDYDGEYDETYWATAAAGNINLILDGIDVPKYLEFGNEPYEDMMQESVDVSTAAQLETAIGNGSQYIRIVDDFEADRTFTVTADTVIFTTAAHTVTRSADFAGDIFAVDGAALTLGNPSSTTTDLLTIDGNKDNVTVAVTGSAVKVEEGSSASILKNVTIANCEAPYGAAIYVAIPEDTEAGTFSEVAFNGTLSECASTDEESTAPIWSGGLVKRNGNPVYDGIVYQMQTIASTSVISGTLSDKVSLEMVYNVNIVEELEDEIPELHYTMGDEELVIEGTELPNGSFSFDIERININHVADDMNLYVTYGYEQISNVKSFSAQDYFDGLYAAYPENTAQNSLLANLIVFADKLQTYADSIDFYGIGAPIEYSGWEAEFIDTESVPEETDNARRVIVSAQHPEDYMIRSASLNVSDRIALYFGVRNVVGSRFVVEANDEVVLDVEIDKNHYNSAYYYLDRLSPLDYGTVFTASLYNYEGGLEHQVQYSVNSYAYSFWNNSNELYSDLARAIYRYGLAAAAYIAD